MARGRTVRMLTTVVDAGGEARRPDELIVEEPLAIELDGQRITTTMRTPGHDFELAAGFCFTEGLLGGAPVLACRYCGTRVGREGAPPRALETGFNVVTVDTGGAAPPPAPRLGTTTSSCGLCGSESIDRLGERLDPLPPGGAGAFTLMVLAAAPERVRASQSLFAATGAVHAAAAFGPDGEPVVVREDVGRHNAVDKVVGHLLLDRRLPAGGFGLYISGRASFEIVQKAWAAGFPAVVAVSAPTALAVETARRAGLLLAGFVRGSRMNVYAPERPGG